MKYRNYAIVITSLSMAACQPHDGAEISVQSMWQATPLVYCQPLARSNLVVENFQFYLSDFKINNQQLTLQPDPRGLQHNGVVLIGGDCHDAGNWRVKFAEPLPDGQISFTLGVPFALNHQNPLTQASPLNVPEMFWTWQQGHKFLRLALREEQTQWQFHLGSLACQSPSMMRAPDNCLVPNRISYTLNYRRGDVLKVDFAMLLTGMQPLVAGECMGDSNSPVCQPIMSNLNNLAVFNFVRP
ncbi:MbnP family protein [Pseudoalteromonas fenneropenaei]|uniref:MbnP family protein n=1 Tax=Pseudoalteromonas fenneropenaei TaxID=1737459 RepID=A0ABV7CG22_9GAMM